MREQRWQLFVDESGDFSHIEDRSCVVGFLSRAPSELAQERVRKSLHIAFPEVPWPYHAKLLHLKASWLFWAARTQSPLTFAAVRLFAAAPEGTKHLIRRIQGQLNDGKEPDYEDLTRMEELMRCEVGYRAFCYAAKERRNSLLRHLKLALEVDSLGTHRVVMAGLCSPHGEQIARDSYLSGLTVLLERTAQSLLLSGGTHQVALHVATRDVLDPVLGKEVLLNRSHLEFATQSARFRTERVRFSLNETLPFADATPGLMVADILANRALKVGTAHLMALHEALNSLGVQTCVGELSFCASTGVARDEVLLGPDSDIEKVKDVQPSWAREQAVAWISAAHVEGK